MAGYQHRSKPILECDVSPRQASERIHRLEREVIVFVEIEVNRITTVIGVKPEDRRVRDGFVLEADRKIPGKALCRVLTGRDELALEGVIEVEQWLRWELVVPPQRLVGIDQIVELDLQRLGQRVRAEDAEVDLEGVEGLVVEGIPGLGPSQRARPRVSR